MGDQPAFDSLKIFSRRQLAPPIAHPSLSGVLPQLEPALQSYNQSNARIRYQLAAVLSEAQLPDVLQNRIFDLAELWFCVGEERRAEIKVTEHEQQVVYQTIDPHQKLPLCTADSLRAVRVAGVSHDQGWANSSSKNRNTTTDSWTWVEMGLTLGGANVVDPERVYINRQADSQYNYYEEDFDCSTALVKRWEPGMQIHTRCRAMFPGWVMAMAAGRVITFHAF